jgi:hypothetical protein
VTRVRFACMTLLTLLGTLCAGCGHTLQVRARVIEPAGIPVRAFPYVWLEQGQLPAERELARGLASHLGQTPGIDVRLVDGDQLAAARAGGTLRPATVVISLRLQTRERTRVQWTTRPETVCDALGCFSVNRSYNYDIPILDGELVVSVTDAQTSQELQHAVLKASEEGRNYDEMLPRLLLALAKRLQQVTEQRVVAVGVTLLEVDLASVTAALRSAEAGDWLAARERLESAHASGELESLDREMRARALYDLAQVRRFGAREGEPVLVAMQSARAALEQALSLDPDALYSEALAVLDADVRRRRMVDDQRAAADQNFAIERSATTNETLQTP